MVKTLFLYSKERKGLHLIDSFIIVPYDISHFVASAFFAPDFNCWLFQGTGRADLMEEKHTSYYFAQ